MKIILMGPPGAGKGTQSDAIMASYPVAHISTGDILRENVKSQSELGVEAKGYMDAGALVPDDLIIKMMERRLNQDDARAGFLLDGFPRTVAQASALDDLVKKLGVSIDAVILIDAGDDVVIRRLVGRRLCSSCGAIYNLAGHPPKTEGVCDKCSSPLMQRDDDTEPVIRRRLSVYHRETAPLVEYYENTGKLRRVDGSGAPDSALSCLEALKI